MKTMYMKMQLRFKEPPKCNEANSLNNTPCCISILTFLIPILIMMSFSFSLIPTKNGDGSLVQDVMLSCSNFTLLLLYFTCYSGAQMVVCLLVGVEISSSLTPG